MSNHKTTIIQILIAIMALAVMPETLWSQYGRGSGTGTVNISLSPSSATVSVNQSLQFTAKITPASNSGAKWAVNGVPGGDATVGTISTGGLYKAPAGSPSPSTVTVTVTSVADPTKSAKAIVTIASGVSVTLSPASASVQVSKTQQFTATVSGSSNSAVTWSVNGVGGGNSTVGSVASSGLYTAPATVPSIATVTITATSAADPTKSAQATVTVVAAVSVTLSPSAASVAVSATRQFSAAVGGTSNTAVAWSVNGVANGNSTVGTVSASGLYTAPAAVPSAATVTVTATSAADSTKAGQAAATIVAGISVAVSPTSASVAVSGTQQFTATVSGTSNTSVSWRVNSIAGGNSTVGTVSTSGLYTAPLAAPSGGSVTITATSAADATKQASASITVTSPALTITTSALPNGVTGVAYNATVAATGGTTPYTWSITAGMLPPGVGLSTTSGAISGTPSAGGTYNVSMQVTDARGQVASKSLSLAIAAVLVITTSSLPNGTAGVAYSATLTASSGTPPVTWMLASGQLPAGLSLSTSGTLSGTPTTVSSYNFTVQAKDSGGQSASKACIVVVTSALSIVTTSLPGGTVGTAYSAAISATGGTAPYAFSVASGQLPGGLSLSASGSLSGTPTTSGSFNFSLQAADAGGQTAAQAFTVPVATAPAPLPNNVGGLTSFPSVSLGPNLLLNPSFDQIGPDGKPIGWSDYGFAADSATHRTGTGSHRITDSNTLLYSASASQTLNLSKGVYDLSGWVKLSNMAGTIGDGVRICLSAPPDWPWTLARVCSDIIKGTSDWQQLTLSKVAIPQDTPAAVSLETYNKPDGTAWFDDMQLQREQYPVQAFMLYPNYRGMLFDDQSQTARFQLSVDPPAGTAFADYQVKGTVKDETTGAQVAQSTFPAAASGVAQFDFSSLPVGRTYLVVFSLVNTVGGTGVYDYPAYRIAKVAGLQRQSMTFSFDDQNRFLIRGTPAFLLGVYDSGLGYTTDEATWENMLTTERRLFELPINMYLNYWYGVAGNSSMLPLMNVLQSHGAMFLQTSNCFSGNTIAQMGGSGGFWWETATEADVQTRASHPAFAGVYAADECTSVMAQDVFSHRARTVRLDPDGLTLGMLLGDSGLPIWRDTLDLMGTDPYPLYGAEPAGGYPLSQVADWTKANRAAVSSARPIVTTIQFFQATGNSRWPTQAELRNMSYMAITEGANGLFYWSLGTNALAYSCASSSDWCPQRIDYFTRLKAVMSELKGLEPALVTVDRPTLLSGNSNSAIKTRVKSVAGTSYLIAYNSTNATVSTTFTWSQPIIGATVYKEARTAAVSGTTFTDSFGPYEAHVYLITTNP